MSSPPWRILNRDGTFNVKRADAEHFAIRDFYHRALRMGWPSFLVGLVCSFFLINIGFALMYILCGRAALHGVDQDTPFRYFLDAFFFSVQTLATIGYGKITPVGIPANLVVTFEAMTGLLGLAIATGLLFARFSRPTSRVVFSNWAVITAHDGVPSLMFRIANERMNQIVEARVTVSLSQIETTREGERYRTFNELKLERERSPIFAATWTIVHPITEESPLRGLNKEEMIRREVELIVAFTGTDDTFAQTINSRFSYIPDEIVWDRNFKDMMDRKSRTVFIHVGRIHDLED